MELERGYSTIWRRPNDLGLELRAAPELLRTTPTPSLDPAAPPEPKEKVGYQRPDPNAWVSLGNRRGPSGPAAFLRRSCVGPAPTQRLLGHGRTGDPSRGAVPALVTSQCHMQIGRRHGLPACGSQSGDGNAARRPRAETKTREQGPRGVSPDAGPLGPKPVGTHLGEEEVQRAGWL